MESLGQCWGKHTLELLLSACCYQQSSNGQVHETKVVIQYYFSAISSQ